MRAVEAEGVHQRFGRRSALADLSFEIEAGESVALLGDNGSGKTTLLRLLATASRPAAGRLRILGLDAATRRAELRGRVGYLAHGTGLYPALTALENLEFFADLQGVDRGRARAVLDEVGLEGAARRRAGDLSRGMQQRLALARTILHAPEVMLLDEPDAGLDDAGRRLLPRLAAGRTLIIATHDRALAREFCSRALHLAAGRLVLPGVLSAPEAMP